MKHIYVINPSAGGGNTEKKYLPQILRFVKSGGMDYEIHRTLSAGDTSAWVKRRAESGEHIRFYAVGGDGTVNDVMSGMVCHDNAELAIVPCGTGNDFVRNWTKRKPNFALSGLIDAKPTKIDVIKYGDSYSINMLNIGADSEVVARAALMKSRYPGSLGYIAGALAIMPKGPHYHMTYSIDDGEEVEGDFLLICIGNGKFCGGGFKSCPKAELSDGKLDLCIVNAIKGSKLLPLMMTYRSGKHLDDSRFADIVRYVQCEKFRLTAHDPVSISKDGEISAFQSAEFEVLHKQLNLVIPTGAEFI